VTDPWLAVLAAGVGTLAFRVSFVALFGVVEEIPPTVEEVLEFVPPAVLAALVAPAFLAPEGSVAVDGNLELAAGAVAVVVAWRTENVLATIASGMATLWLLGWLL